MRNISFGLTKEQFLAGLAGDPDAKDITRRLGWKNLKPGDRLQAVEKCMGLKPGEKIKRLGVIEVLDVRREPLNRMIERHSYGQTECKREGFPTYTPAFFVNFFCKSHPGCKSNTVITRIRFRHVK